MKLEVMLTWSDKAGCWVVLAPYINPTGRATGAVTAVTLDRAFEKIRAHVLKQKELLEEAL